MQYSQTNVLVSLQLDLVTQLKGLGYDVYFQATGETVANTLLLSPPKAVMTLVPAFPADPKFLVTAKADYPTGLNGDTPHAEQVVVPAMAMTVADRVEIEAMGIGHQDRVWERKVELFVFAHDVDPTAPPALDPVWLDFAAIEKASFTHNEAVRFGIKVTALVHYVE